MTVAATSGAFARVLPRPIVVTLLGTLAVAVALDIFDRAVWQWTADAFLDDPAGGAEIYYLSSFATNVLVPVVVLVAALRLFEIAREHATPNAFAALFLVGAAVIAIRWLPPVEFRFDAPAGTGLADVAEIIGSLAPAGGIFGAITSGTALLTWSHAVVAIGAVGVFGLHRRWTRQLPPIGPDIDPAAIDGAIRRALLVTFLVAAAIGLASLGSHALVQWAFGYGSTGIEESEALFSDGFLAWLNVIGWLSALAGLLFLALMFAVFARQSPGLRRGRFGAWWYVASGLLATLVFLALPAVAVSARIGEDSDLAWAWFFLSAPGMWETPVLAIGLLEVARRSSMAAPIGRSAEATP